MPNYGAEPRSLGLSRASLLNLFFSFHITRGAGAESSSQELHFTAEERISFLFLFFLANDFKKAVDSGSRTGSWAWSHIVLVTAAGKRTEKTRAEITEERLFNCEL